MRRHVRRVFTLCCSLNDVQLPISNNASKNYLSSDQYHMSKKFNLWLDYLDINEFIINNFSCYISHDKNINEVPILFTKMVIIDRYNYNIISCFIYYIRFTNF